MNLLKLNESGISFESCCLAENKRWFFLNECNALCNMNIDEDIINFVGIIPWENTFSKYLVADIKYYKGNLILIPRATSIVIYNIKKRSFKKIELKSPQIKSKNLYIEWLKFNCSIILDESIYMIPRTFPAIVELDLRTYKLMYYSDWVSEADKLIFENEAFFWSDYVVKDKKIILAAANADYLMTFDTITKNYKIIRCENENKGFSGIESFEENLLLASRKDGVIKLWDSQKHSLKNFSSMPQDFSVERIIGFSKLIRLGREIIAIPLWANMFLKISTQEEKIICLKKYRKVCEGDSETTACCAWIERGKLYCHNNILKCIDIFGQDGYESSIDLKISEDFCRCMEQDMQNMNQSIIDNTLFCVEDYLRYIFRTDTNQGIALEKKPYGQLIYNMLKK